MFTGIVEECGTVKNISLSGTSGSLSIETSFILDDTKVGDSIAVNGVCLTVVKIEDKVFFADVMAETLRQTSLGILKAGSKVNLERAMAANGRFGGHIVSGHIDGTGTISAMKKEGNATWVTVSAKCELLKYVIERGSVTLDGISLTVAYVDDKCLKVSVIPHTGEETSLLLKKVGDPVNIENDIIGKYVEKLLKTGSTHDGSSLTYEMLEKFGI